MEPVSSNSNIPFTDWRSARDNLRKWREEKKRRSFDVLHLGSVLLSDHGRKLGDEIWTVYEQVVIAALDCGEFEQANQYLATLKRQFPKSRRVLKLEGMVLEAMGSYEEALKLYDTALAENENNAEFLKRKIAIYKAKGQTSDAIELLTDYLETFMSDHEAWMELADLYISQNQYGKAAFCLEELILSNPHHHLYHQRLAEISYSMRTTDSLELALQHFAHAIKLNPNNMRALYGHHLTCCALSKSKTRDNTVRYMDWTRTLIIQHYQQQAAVDRLN